MNGNALKVRVLLPQLRRDHLLDRLVRFRHQVGGVLLRAKVFRGSGFGGGDHVSRLVGDGDQEVMDFLQVWRTHLGCDDYRQ